MGKKLFTLEEQQTQFEYGQHCFLEGKYTEAEFAFRHVIQSANEHNDFETVVSGMIWLNRTLINNSKVEQLFQQLVQLPSLLQKHTNDEDKYFFRLHQAVFDQYFLMGGAIEKFEKLLEELRNTQYTSLMFIVGSNLLYTYIVEDEIDKGMALFEDLLPYFEKYKTPNRMTKFMHMVYGFILFYTNRDYTACNAIMERIEVDEDIHIMEDLSYLYEICKGLNEAQLGNVDTGQMLFASGVSKVKKLKHIKQEIKLWVRTLKELGLKEEIIHYQELMIQLLEDQYASEVSKIRKEMIEEMSRQEFEGKLYVDQMTGAYNRNFYEELIEKQQHVKNYTVAVLDIDRFKSINDTYGHMVGDDAIQFIASMLLNSRTKHDVEIVRYGGDEFIILMPYPVEDMREMLEKLHARVLRTPFVVDRVGISINMSISIGVGYTANKYVTIEELFAVADAAIYEAKVERGCIVERSIEENLLTE